MVTATNESSNQPTNRYSEDTHMAEHKHGEMEISVQEKTFEGFMKFTTRGAVIIIVALILLALING